MVYLVWHLNTWENPKLRDPEAVDQLDDVDAVEAPADEPDEGRDQEVAELHDEAVQLSDHRERVKTSSLLFKASFYHFISSLF